jgi:hypothetical protein
MDDLGKVQLVGCGIWCRAAPEKGGKVETVHLQEKGAESTRMRVPSRWSGGSETRLILVGINPCSPDTRLDAQETPAKSDGDRVSSVVGPKLPNEVFNVKINRSFGNGEATRYLFIAVAIANQP